MKHKILVLLLVAQASLVIGLRARAELQLAPDWEGEQRVETLTVHLDVGDDGGDLREPLALDLGLGFPLLLHPVGREEGESLPFGAVPQMSTAASSVAAGARVAFTFSARGDAGQDALRTSPQLLAGVRVSDIARIGFVSRAADDWTLAGYEIEINGRNFVSNDQVDLRPSDAVEAAQFELAELSLSIVLLQDELADLVALQEAMLAEPSDTEQLMALAEALVPLLDLQQRLEGQVEGTCPWFVELEFESPWRDEEAIESARVTLITHAHSGADTSNYVYFQTGGRKYLLGSPAEPLRGELGPQRFELDLTAGPLAAADLRGYAVGMLASNHPYADAPDRWHPQRILVELDGRIVYDSDESQVDHDSLEAVRVIPPVHVDADAKLVTNTPNVRETFLWEAGQAVGLDPVAGGALPLPDPDHPLYPEAESGTDADALDEANESGFSLDDDVAADDEMGPMPEVVAPPSNVVPFPGEVDHWYFDDQQWFGDPWSSQPWPNWVPSGNANVGPFVVAGGGAEPLWGSIADLVGNLNQMIDQNVPDPSGETFQIAAVWIEGTDQDYGETFHVRWTVAGDENEIAEYEVQLVAVRPDQHAAYGETIISEIHSPDGTYDHPLVLPAGGGNETRYIAPRVIARPRDDALAEHVSTGPARGIYPHTASGYQRLILQPEFTYRSYDSQNNVAVWHQGAAHYGLHPPAAGTVVWAAEQVQSHNAVLFDSPHSMIHAVAWPRSADRIEFDLATPVNDFPRGRYRLTADLGFLGGTESGSDAAFTFQCMLHGGNVAPHACDERSRQVATPAGDSPTSLVTFRQDFHTDDLSGADVERVVIHVTVEGGTDDPDHPPAMFGARLIYMGN